MGKPYPKEFRDDVVRVARSSGMHNAQLAKEFGVSEASIYNWVKQAVAEVSPGSQQTHFRRKAIPSKRSGLNTAAATHQNTLASST